MSGDKLLARGNALPYLARTRSMKLTGRASTACKPHTPAARPATYRRRSATSG